jgi:hypothetical protein
MVQDMVQSRCISTARSRHINSSGLFGFLPAEMTISTAEGRWVSAGKWSNKGYLDYVIYIYIYIFIYIYMNITLYHYMHNIYMNINLYN